MTKFFKYFMLVTLVSYSDDKIKPSDDNADIAGTWIDGDKVMSF